jgi:hypothetical protein
LRVIFILSAIRFAATFPLLIVADNLFIFSYEFAKSAIHWQARVPIPFFQKSGPIQTTISRG